VLGFVIFAMVDCTFMTNHLLYTAEPANDTGSELCNVFTQEKTTIDFWWFYKQLCQLCWLFILT